ncbi:DUF397 domain-containing protein [Streptomyces hygroscopicus]|uniref:DUF397 domain-containing protein n=1 Tax=Streptomyces hygroscopicus TaxID=1912 RepID=UPI0036862586
MSVERSRCKADELAWFKSSYSAGDGGQCVEVAMEWRKSSRSGGAGGECVEVASCLHAVHVRDSKDITRPGLTVGTAAWTAFLSFAVR